MGRGGLAVYPPSAWTTMPTAPPSRLRLAYRERWTNDPTSRERETPPHSGRWPSRKRRTCRSAGR